MKPGTLFERDAIPTPDITQYDWIVISSSAGKDSQAMLDVVCEQARACGVLERVVVVHCDLGRVEWKGTPQLAEAQAARYGVRFLKVRREQGDLLNQVERRGMWPSPRQRYCTSDQKRAPVHRTYTALAALTRATGRTTPVRILSCQGMRADESPSRQKLNPFQRDERASNTRRVVDNWLPLHAWSLGQVWARVRAGKTADLVHPAYALGMPRLSCCFCIFAPKPALMLAGRHNPELLAEYVRVEQQIGHTFRVDLSLADVQAAIARGEAPGEIRTWEM